MKTTLNLNHLSVYKKQSAFNSSFKAQITENREYVSSEQKTVPQPTLLAYMTSCVGEKKPSVRFYNTLSLNQMSEKYGQLAADLSKDLAKRAGQKGQVLDWIGVLPHKQIERLEEIYSLAESLKTNGGGKLAVIGIGGSKHTVENLLSLNGYSDKAVFLSVCDPDSLKEFFEKNYKNGENPAVIVASKSGTTLEPSYDFEMVQKLLGEDFKNYVCITDTDESKSKLRKIANQKGYKCGIIHDDCGGRFGAFDDHALVALAYCGMKKEDMKKMLEASISAQKEYSNPDINQNLALQRAAFNTESVANGKNNQYDYYFGERFEGTTLWNTQLKKESHKALYKQSGDLIGPAFLHNSTESDLDEGNTTSFYTFNRVKNNGSADYKVANALFDGSLKAYSDRNPVSVVELKDFSPESIARFVELKHFETMYTGMMLRAQNAKNVENVEVLPEVEQPHVKIYKKEVEKILNK